MKIAIVSDIHGNHYALEAVMQSRDFSKVDHLFVLGDIVGYYYEPKIVLEKLNQYSLDMIIGNHEVFLKNKNTLEEVRKKYGKGIDVALATLGEEYLLQLMNAPEQKYVEIDNVKALLCHGSPWQIDEYIYPDAPLEKLESCADYALKKNCNFLFMGHTHYPFMFSHQGCVVSNPGSVGQARDKGGVACWQLLDTITRVLVQKRTPYHIEPLQRDVREQDDHLHYLTTILERS